jgi:hypothetical protein
LDAEVVSPTSVNPLLRRLAALTGRAFSAGGGREGDVTRFPVPAATRRGASAAPP